MGETGRFTVEELNRLTDTSFLLSKRRIQGKISHWLSNSKTELEPIVQELLPQDILAESLSPKISRGENYRGLPYQVLDYPRLFSTEKSFSFRTLCWWGYYFTCSLFISGAYLDEYHDALNNILAELPPDTLCYLGEDPWMHALEPEYYRTCAELDLKKWEEQRSVHHFAKLARKLPLTEYEALPGFAKNTLESYLLSLFKTKC